jgi:Protein of unknown function (DUF2752)
MKPPSRLWALLPMALLVIGIILPLPDVTGRHIGNLPSICPLQNYAHIPCPACGLTRAVVCLLHGDFTRSVAFHPLGGLVIGLFIAWAVLAFKQKALTHKQQNAFALTLSGLLFLFWVLRFLGYVSKLPG